MLLILVAGLASTNCANSDADRELPTSTEVGSGDGYTARVDARFPDASSPLGSSGDMVGGEVQEQAVDGEIAISADAASAELDTDLDDDGGDLSPGIEACCDGVDNDNDGLTDLDDLDCIKSPGCSTGCTTLSSCSVSTSCDCQGFCSDEDNYFRHESCLAFCLNEGGCSECGETSGSYDYYGRRGLNSFRECLQKECGSHTSWGTEAWRCIRDNCGQELTSCTSSPYTGSCPDFVRACWFGHSEVGSCRDREIHAPDVHSYLALDSCVDKLCGVVPRAESADSCVVVAASICGSTSLACKLDGDTSCANFIGCIGACAEGGSCTEPCLFPTSMPDASVAGDVIGCIVDECVAAAEFGLSCVSAALASNCSAQVAACLQGL